MRSFTRLHWRLLTRIIIRIPRSLQKQIDLTNKRTQQIHEVADAAGKSSGR